ncbi:hypothetical protein FQN52_006689 [Onygenales sp. PD_12]|nr:hypothetical protein FQN52_006689 [Onygenales sp. PD_12]
MGSSEQEHIEALRDWRNAIPRYTNYADGLPQLDVEERRYHCERCDLSFTTSNWLAKHMETARLICKAAESLNPYRCKPSNIIGFATKQNLTRHYNTERHPLPSAPSQPPAPHRTQAMSFHMFEFWSTKESCPGGKIAKKVRTMKWTSGTVNGIKVDFSMSKKENGHDYNPHGRLISALWFGS